MMAGQKQYLPWASGKKKAIPGRKAPKKPTGLMGLLAGAKSKPAPKAQEVRCTKTRKNIKVCNCAAQHVSSLAGVEKFRKALGSPMGGAAKPKDPKIPTTRNAKPYRYTPGDRVRPQQ